MLLCANGLSSVRLIRITRAAGDVDLRTFERCGIQYADPQPAPRWTLEVVESSQLAKIDPGWQKAGLHAAVPHPSSRLRLGCAKNTVYQRGLPDDAFLDLGGGLLCASPELVFVEMARVMSRPALVMLGYELCGTFSRNVDDPRMGDVAMSVPPATSVQRIRTFLDECHGIRGMGAAREALEQVADNAWSSMESVVSTAMVLDVSDFGYGLGPLVLNSPQQVGTENGAPGLQEFRIPDIVVADTPVGINYDGGDHLDFSSVEQAFNAKDENALRAAEHAMREKVLDEMHRNRELMVSGMTVLPVTKEDVFTPSGLDCVMRSVVSSIERLSDKDVSQTRALLDSDWYRTERQYLIWSLYPWEKAKDYAKALKAMC
jgi:hypothetical protein